MSSALRSKGKSTIVWALMGLLLLGLGGFGVTNFSGSISSIGSVGDVEIGVNAYGRALRAEMQAQGGQQGRALTFQEASAIGLDAQVRARMFAEAALDDAAQKAGISVGDAEVARQITGAQAFQGLTGGFDREAYRMALRQQGLSEAEFEGQLRAESARLVLQGAIVGGVKAPKALTTTLADWILETRDLTVAELLPSDLSEPVGAPDDATLKAWYDAHPELYTAPETREISYLLLSPEMMLPEAQPSEEDLRAAYESRKAEFVTPERRLVERLIYPTAEEATAAKARFDKGEATFEALAAERGLTLADIDLGEAVPSDLGAAADAVFGLTEPGVVGPFDTDLGPALYAMNGILEAQEVTFDQAREDLASELSMDRARRLVQDAAPALEDELAGGATLEDLAKAGPAKLEKISFTAGSDSGIAAYQAFREAAAAVTAEDFPTLAELDDGGLFALRLDAVVPPALKPFDEVREQAVADWQKAETHTRLVALAEELKGKLTGGATLASLGLVTTHYAETGRGTYIESLPAPVSERAFEGAAGETAVIETPDTVHLVTVDRINTPDPKGEDMAGVVTSLDTQIGQQMAQDLYGLFSRRLQDEAGVRMDQSAVNAVHAQMN